MTSSIFIRLATTGALFALTTVGCSTVSPGQLNAASDAPRPAKSAVKAQAKALKALDNGQHDEAIGYAEAAVLTDPGNPQLRALLGQAYLSAGRFSSASASFDEAMLLGNRNARAVIGLALADIAQGQVGAARQLLDAHQTDLPVADYGLAMALAGDTKRAVYVLTNAIRSDMATVKTRQNLALAYALDGRWREARIMAAQDLAPEEVDVRIASWAQMARPGAYETRVASLLGVVPVSDVGRPMGIALNDSQPQVEMVASVAIPHRDGPLPAVGPAPQAGGKAVFAAAAEPDVAVAPERLAPAAAPAAPIIKAPASSAKATPLKMASASSAPSAPKRSAGAAQGTHVVQLGAFSSPENAARGWAVYQKRHAALKNYSSASARITVKGRTLYRLAAMGFDDAGSASALCSSLKSEGGTCIVRNMHAGGQVQYAAGTMTGRVLASR